MGLILVYMYHYYIPQRINRKNQSAKTNWFFLLTRNFQSVQKYWLRSVEKAVNSRSGLCSKIIQYATPIWRFNMMFLQNYNNPNFQTRFLGNYYFSVALLYCSKWGLRVVKNKSRVSRFFSNLNWRRRQIERQRATLSMRPTEKKIRLAPLFPPTAHTWNTQYKDK